jgi:transposase-like protein
MPSRKETIKANRETARKANARKVNLRDPIYHDEDAARAHLESLLWPHGPVCPRCGVMEDRITKLAGKSTRPGVYKCKDCRKPFTVTVATVMERSHVPLTQWVLAAHYMAASKKGMSALQLQRMMGCTYETAWFLFHRLREAARPLTPSPLGGAGKIIEADETYVGGSERTKHANKRLGALAWDAKKPVLVLVQREGGARSFHIPDVTSRTLRTALVENAHRASHLMTDGAIAYISVGEEFARHGHTDHIAGEYARDDGFTHSNSAESYFAILKRGVYGTFHAVSEAHLHRYLVEFDFRFTHREACGVGDAARAEELLRGVRGKRLYYHQPA